MCVFAPRTASITVYCILIYFGTKCNNAVQAQMLTISLKELHCYFPGKRRYKKRNMIVYISLNRWPEKLFLWKCWSKVTFSSLLLNLAETACWMSSSLKNIYNDVLAGKSIEVQYDPLCNIASWIQPYVWACAY